MANYYKFELPFMISRACRCSFEVIMDNGKTAYISNENLLTLMNRPCTEMMTVDRTTRDGIVQTWIVVAKTEWTFGFKKRPLFNECGQRIYRND